MNKLSISKNTNWSSLAQCQRILKSVRKRNVEVKVRICSEVAMVGHVTKPKKIVLLLCVLLRYFTAATRRSR